MGQVLVRNLDDAVVLRLKARAKDRGVSLEQYLRDFLTEQMHPSKSEIFDQVKTILEGRHFEFHEAPEDLVRQDRLR